MFGDNFLFLQEPSQQTEVVYRKDGAKTSVRFDFLFRKRLESSPNG